MKKKWLAALAAFAVVMAAGVTLAGCKNNSDEVLADNNQQNNTYYTVTFYPNAPVGATGAENLVPQTWTYLSGSTQQLPEYIFTIDGYRLAGWANNAGATSASYSVGNSFNVYGDSSFYAVWEVEIVTSEDILLIEGNVVIGLKSTSSAITEITIPSNVTSIGQNAFYNCYKLKSVSIPVSVKSIGYGAFSGCSNLTINYAGTRAQWEALQVETSGVPVVCSDDSLGSGSQTGVLTIKNDVVIKCDTAATGYVEIPNGVTEIAENAFSNCVNIKGVVIPEGVKSIGYGAFKYCSDMLTVEIPSSVTYIGSGAFEYCNNLTRVNFTGTLNQLIALALDTKGLAIEKVSVACRYGAISSPVFFRFASYGYEGLSGWVIISSGVTTITKEAFKGCTSIETVVIPDGVTRIAADAFKDCSGIVGVVISKSVTSVASSAFDGCTNLKNAVFTGSPEQWKEISGNNSLGKCSIGYADMPL